jgi:hypothetical protein
MGYIKVFAWQQWPCSNRNVSIFFRNRWAKERP